MSCEIKLFAKIEILEIVRKFLGLSDDEQNWINLCFVSISPTKEM